MHDKKSNLQPSKFLKKPFTGSTKIKLNDQKSSIHALEQSDDPPITNDTPISESDDHPYVGSFIHEEDAFYAQQFDTTDGNVFEHDPTICMMSSPCSYTPPSKDLSFCKDEYRNLHVGDMVHPRITDRIHKYHAHKGNKPCAAFVRHHQQNLQRIPRNCFDPFCDVSLMADGGANVWALTDQHCFYFYIPQDHQLLKLEAPLCHLKLGGEYLLNLVPMFTLSPRSTTAHRIHGILFHQAF
jgi:hypothetical protein